MRAKTVTAAILTSFVVSGCQPDLGSPILEPEFGKPGVDCTVEPHPSCKDDGSSGGEDGGQTVALASGMQMPAIAAEVKGPKGKLGTTTLEGSVTTVDLDMNLGGTATGACMLSISDEIPPGMHAGIENGLRAALTIDLENDPHDLSFVIDLDAALAGANSSVHEIHAIGPGGAGAGGIWVRIGHNNEAAQDPPVDFVTVTYSDSGDPRPNDETIVDPTATRVFTFESGGGGLVRSITRVDVNGNGLRGNDPTAGLLCPLEDDVVLTLAPAS
jgi:hypothetical protein